MVESLRAIRDDMALRSLDAGAVREDFNPMLYEVAQRLDEELCGFLNGEKPFAEADAATSAFHKWEDENLVPPAAEPSSVIRDGLSAKCAPPARRSDMDSRTPMTKIEAFQLLYGYRIPEGAMESYQKLGEELAAANERLRECRKALSSLSVILETDDDRKGAMEAQELMAAIDAALAGGGHE
jgi:hypothetical protein